jgi:hypothetical protein
MPIPRAPWLAPALATAAVLVAGLALAAAADQRGDADSAHSARATAGSGTASREILIASPGTGADGGPSPGVALAGECSVSGEVPAPAGASVPAGATLWRGVFAGFERAGDRRAVRAAVAEVAGVALEDVVCTELAVATGDAPVATERSAAADAVSGSSAAGSGSCFADHEPARPGGLPEGAVLRVSAGGEYRNRDDETAVRAAVATVAGVAPARVECSYYVPPIGSCYAELAPAPGDPQVPEGATGNGFVNGDYTAREQVEGLRAALAAMAGLDPSGIICEDHPDMPVPIEPGPGGIEPVPLPAGAGDAAAPVR